MTAKVSTLYRNGIRLSTNKVGKTVEGDLNLSASKHPVTGRVCHESVILGDGGICLLPQLFDAQCHVIAGYGFRLRGFEIIGAREVAQEWWCVPLANGVDHARDTKH